MRLCRLPCLVLPVVWAVALILTAPPSAGAQNRGVVEAELERLRTALGITQMSAAVAESGTIVWVRHFGGGGRRGDAVRYPIASLTKPFAAAAAFKLIEQDKLSLDAAISRPDGTRPLVRHLLTQTGSGTPGNRFVYSSDLYTGLDKPIAQAGGATLGQVLTSTVLRPAGLRNTSIGPAFSASSGLVSTPEDVLRFVTALEGGQIVSRARLSDMFQAPRDGVGRPLPYAHGWFVQQISGQQVRWHFGQQADSSAIVVSLPGRRLTFVVLAQSDKLSSPFWLQFGDLRWSPAAMTFLTQWARLKVDLPEARTLMLDALVALAKNDRTQASALAGRAVGLAPALVNAPDLTLLAAFARSGDKTLRDYGRGIAKRVLAADAGHPRALVDLAVLMLQDGQAAEAKKLLRQVVDGGQATPEIDALARRLLKENGG